MIYNDRVVLIYETHPDDELTHAAVKTESEPIPCMRNSLTNQEMMGLFGKYNLDSFKLHLQGVYADFSEVVYHGQQRKIAGKSHHRNSTVIFL